MTEFLNINSEFKVVVDFGVGDKRTTIDINQLCQSIGLYRCRGMLFLHSFTGCDYTCGFYGIGKTRWLDLYLDDKISFHEVFNDLSQSPKEITQEHELVITKFVLLAYNCKNSNSMSEGRFDCLTHQHSETLRSLPPSESALFQHIKRSTYI